MGDTTSSGVVNSVVTDIVCDAHPVLGSSVLFYFRISSLSSASVFSLWSYGQVMTFKYYDDNMFEWGRGIYGEL